VNGSGKNKQVERSVLEPPDQVVGQPLPHVEAQFGIAQVQVGDDERQEIRPERLHDADADRAREHGLSPPRDLGDLVDIRQDPPRARGDFLPLGRHHDAGRDRSTSCTPSSSSSFDSCADSVGWVTLRPLGRAAEMQRLGDECDVSELLKTGHDRPLIDIIYQNSLKFDWTNQMAPYLSAT
jgi:hypothetical protein